MSFTFHPHSQLHERELEAGLTVRYRALSTCDRPECTACRAKQPTFLLAQGVADVDRWLAFGVVTDPVRAIREDFASHLICAGGVKVSLVLGQPWRIIERDPVDALAEANVACERIPPRFFRGDEQLAANLGAAIVGNTPVETAEMLLAFGEVTRCLN